MHSLVCVKHDARTCELQIFYPEKHLSCKTCRVDVQKIASLMPGWSTEHIKARLHNHKRLIKTEGKDTGVQDLRVALAEIVHRVRHLYSLTVSLST